MKFQDQHISSWDYRKRVTLSALKKVFQQDQAMNIENSHLREIFTYTLNAKQTQQARKGHICQIKVANFAKFACQKQLGLKETGKGRGERAQNYKKRASKDEDDVGVAPLLTDWPNHP